MNFTKAMMGPVWLLAGIICGGLAATFPGKAAIITVMMVAIAGWCMRAQPLNNRLLTAGAMIIGFCGILLVLR